MALNSSQHRRICKQETKFQSKYKLVLHPDLYVDPTENYITIYMKILGATQHSSVTGSVKLPRNLDFLIKKHYFLHFRVYLTWIFCTCATKYAKSRTCHCVTHRSGSNHSRFLYKFCIPLQFHER